MKIIRDLNPDKYKRIVPYYLYKRFDLTNRLEDFFDFKNNDGGNYYLKFINLIYGTGKQINRIYKSSKVYVDLSLDLTYGAGTVNDPYGFHDLIQNAQYWNPSDCPDVFLKGIRVLTDSDGDQFGCLPVSDAFYTNPSLPENNYNVRYFNWEDEPYVILNLKTNNSEYKHIFSPLSIHQPSNSLIYGGILIDTNPDINYATVFPFIINSIWCLRMGFPFYQSTYPETNPLYPDITEKFYKSNIILNDPENIQGVGINDLSFRDCIIYFSSTGGTRRYYWDSTFNNCIFNEEYDDMNITDSIFNNCLFGQNLDNLPLLDSTTYDDVSDLPDIILSTFDKSIWYNNLWSIGTNKLEYDLFNKIRDIETGTGYFNKYYTGSLLDDVYISLKKSTSIYPFFDKIPVNTIVKQDDFIMDEFYNYSSGSLRKRKIEFNLTFEPNTVLECKISKNNLSYDPKYIDAIFCGYFYEE